MGSPLQCRYRSARGWSAKNAPRHRIQSIRHCLHRCNSPGRRVFRHEILPQQHTRPAGLTYRSDQFSYCTTPSPMVSVPLNLQDSEHGNGRERMGTNLEIA